MAEIKVDTITDSAGTGTPDFSQALSVSKDAVSPPEVNALYKDNICKGWISFDGAGTIAIRDSFNVSGITDNSDGNYTITWDTDFANANYSAVSVSGNDADSDFTGFTFLRNQLAGSIVVRAKNIADANHDPPLFCVNAFGDQ